MSEENDISFSPWALTRSLSSSYTLNWTDEPYGQSLIQLWILVTVIPIGIANTVGLLSQWNFPVMYRKGWKVCWCKGPSLNAFALKWLATVKDWKTALMIIPSILYNSMHWDMLFCARAHPAPFEVRKPVLRKAQRNGTVTATESPFITFCWKVWPKAKYEGLLSDLAGFLLYAFSEVFTSLLLHTFKSWTMALETSSGLGSN